MFLGGAGGQFQPWVVSDVQIQYNWLYKPLAWVPLSLAGKMAVKNSFEIKGAQRVLFDSNTIENNWVNGQVGQAIDLTIRTSGGGGDNAVVNDITITNNVLKNVVAGINTLAADYYCGVAPYTACGNPGSQDRWNISNNLITFYDPTLPGGGKNWMMQVNGGFDHTVDPVTGLNRNIYIPLRDVVFQHNTGISSASQNCWGSVYFSGKSGPPSGWGVLTDNIWLLDNAFCQQPTGDWQQQGIAGMTIYMGYPSTPPYDLTQRFYGNAMYVPPGSKVATWPMHNYATTVLFTYVDPVSFDYQLLKPYWTDTTDGNIAGVQNASLP